MLKRHPGLYLPPRKELHYWDEYEHLGPKRYLTHFAAATPGQLRGEITPAYAILPPTKIPEIKRLFPKLRIIYLIRNPMARAWSAAQMALDRADMRLDEASDAWFIDHFRSAGSICRGDYESCIRNWLAEFDRAQMLILIYEHIASEPLSVLEKVAGTLA
ncbi:MAG: sulfotransferase [Fimbriimonas ginsengisoli]|nr:sulfotransferase [Fimbriimonas ginsengisoli]